MFQVFTHTGICFHTYDQKISTAMIMYHRHLFFPTGLGRTTLRCEIFTGGNTPYHRMIQVSIKLTSKLAPWAPSGTLSLLASPASELFQWYILTLCLKDKVSSFFPSFLSLTPIFFSLSSVKLKFYLQVLKALLEAIITALKWLKLKIWFSKWNE